MKEYKVKVFSDRTEWYNLDGKLHRENGPAIKLANGSKEWYLDGKRHREDGPAIEYTSGSKEWYLHGKLHREDGPAVEWVNGSKQWCLNGKYLAEEEFNNRTQTIEMTVEEISKRIGKNVKVIKK